MSTFLLIGTVLGAFVGFFHMLHVFAQRLGQPGLSVTKTIWQGIWTWGLWTLFGAYVLTFWVLGLLCMGVSRLKDGKPAAS